MSSEQKPTRSFCVTIDSPSHPRPKVVKVNARSAAEAIERVRVACELIDQDHHPRPIDRTFSCDPEQ